jgi:hypothetical protein
MQCLQTTLCDTVTRGKCLFPCRAAAPTVNDNNNNNNAMPAVRHHHDDAPLAVGVPSVAATVANDNARAPTMSAGPVDEVEEIDALFE